MDTAQSPRRLSLDWWHEVEPQLFQVDKLKEAPELQPRVTQVIPSREKTSYRMQGARLVEELEAALRANPKVHLSPLLVADVDGSHFVVDGHHRLLAYRRARRTNAPVRISKMKMPAAIQLSKLVNCGQATLPVHNEQKREAAWQWLAHVTDRGANPYLPTGVTLRDVSGYFGAGVGKSTVQNMLSKIPSVDLADYSEAACDPGTGWPRWKYVRVPKGGYGIGTPEQQEEHRKEKAKERLGRFLADLMGSLGPLGVLEVLRELKAEWQDPDLQAAASLVAEIAAEEEHLERTRGDTRSALAAEDF